MCGTDGGDGGDGSIGGVISPSWWPDWGRHSLNTAQYSPASSPANTRPGVTTLARTPRPGDKVTIALLPSDYAVMVDYKIIQAGPPLVITYLLSLNSRGLSPSLPPSPDNL